MLEISFEKKSYGFVTSFDVNKIEIYKGDSGSMMLNYGIPIAVLSTYNGDPVSSGVSAALPTAKEEISIPEIPIDSVVETPIGTPVDEVATIEIENNSGSEIISANDGFNKIMVDANARGIAGANCL